MGNEEKWRDHLASLLREQNVCVLATQSQEGPYTSLVGFAVTEDLTTLVFATPRHTHKYQNLLSQTRVAACIDNRRNEEADFHEATAVTALGQVEEPTAAEGEELQALYLKRHPYLQSFIQSPSCALMKIKVERYLIVTRFQSVVEVRMP